MCGAENLPIGAKIGTGGACLIRYTNVYEGGGCTGYGVQNGREYGGLR